MGSPGVAESEAPSRPLRFVRRRPAEMRLRARAFPGAVEPRRSVRAFSSDPVPPGIIEECVRAAAQAPSGANKQPWRFVVVTDPELERQIREAAEAEERAFYGGRPPQRWLDDLRPLGTGPDKPFLEDAPALVVVFAERSGPEAGDRNYYVQNARYPNTGSSCTGIRFARVAGRA